jgi:hypothetical protein
MKRLASAPGWDVFAVTPAACIFLVPSGLGGSWDRALAVYVLPFAVAAATLMFIVWRMHSKDIGALTRDLEPERAHRGTLFLDEIANMSFLS